MIRTSTGSASPPPTRSISRSWRTRRSLAWASRGRSPTSSRKRLPPSASSKRPIRRARAPVKAPFSWPNSSLSTSPAGRAAQLSLISGLAARRLWEWIPPPDTLLAGPRLAGDEHGGVGRRHPADLVEHGEQRGGSTDDLLEVVVRLDLFLEVEVLLLEAGALGLGGDPVGDIDPDRVDDGDPAISPAERPHPHADPQHAAGPAAHLQLQAGGLPAGEAGAERLFGPGPAVRRLGEVRQHGPAHQLGCRHAEQLGGAVIDAEEPSIAADRHVGVGCLLVELAIAPLALHELQLDPQPLEFDGGPRGEDPEDEEPPGLGRHGPPIEDRQVAQHPAVAVEQRHAQVALDPHVDELPVARKPLPDPPGMVA